jgi:hypothetical protein
MFLFVKYKKHFFYFLVVNLKYALSSKSCSQRDGGLASAAASTTFVAGDNVSILHYFFRGVTAAVAAE